MFQPYWIYQAGKPDCSRNYIVGVVVYSSPSPVKWKIDMSGLLLFKNFDSHQYIIHIGCQH